MNDCRVGSAASVKERTSNQQNRSTALSTVSHGPSRYPIVRTSWYRLRSPYASLPANLERVAETWNRLAPSFWVPIASEFFLKTWRNAYLHVHDLRHIGKLEANLDSFKTPLTQAESGAYPRDSSRFPLWRPFIYFNRHAPLGQTPSLFLEQLAS